MELFKTEIDKNIFTVYHEPGKTNKPEQQRNLSIEDLLATCSMWTAKAVPLFSKGKSQSDTGKTAHCGVIMEWVKPSEDLNPKSSEGSIDKKLLILLGGGVKMSPVLSVSAVDPVNNNDVYSISA